ncbi:MAG TPA: Gfo/Idh/MocA family oxidoreductase [Acidimicrobiia bacterium]|nr:Gfo/Idh/MocA family oxidoreductase [Acidimicrobiia bacterium]
MSDRTVGVGIIGRGFGLHVVSDAFRKTEGVDVLAPVSARDERAVAALIADPRVDLVSVHSPPFLHDRHVRMALDAGRSVLCDKPFTDSVELSRRLAADVAGAPGVHLLNFEFRFDAARRHTRDTITDGRLGDVERVSWTHYSAGTRHPLRPYGWLFDRALGGGWIGAWASHAVDTLRFTIGEIDRVVSSTPTLTVTHRDDGHGVAHECTAEDGLTAVLALANGAIVTLDSTYAASQSVPPRITIAGRDQTLVNLGDQRVFVVGAEVDDAIARSDDGDRHAAPMRAMAAAVRDSVRAGEPRHGIATFADGVACDEVLDALRAPPLVRVGR